jgi:hypothetical protein
LTTLYATETHRGLVITWTGTDLTGLAGAALSCVFKNRKDGRWFAGAGSFSAPVVTSPGTAQVVSSTNYTPNPTDMVVANIGEWSVQLKATYGDASIDYSVPGTVTIAPRLQDQ